MVTKYLKDKYICEFVRRLSLSLSVLFHRSNNDLQAKVSTNTNTPPSQQLTFPILDSPTVYPLECIRILLSNIYR